MFKAFLETKCIKDPVLCAGQSSPMVHLRIASPSILTKSFLQHGSLFGKDIFRDPFFLLSKSTEII